MKTFTLKTDFFDNETTICIGGQFGAIGTLTIVRLLCAIHRSGYYLTWSEKTAYSLMRDIPGLDRKTLNRIVKRLIHWKMFDAAMFKKHSVLTSIDLQQRYFKAAGRRRRALQSPEPTPYLLITLQPELQPSPDSQQPPVNKNDNNETTPTPQPEPTASKNDVITEKPQTSPPRKHQPIRARKHSWPEASSHNQRFTRRPTRSVAVKRIFAPRSALMATYSARRLK